MGAAAVIITGGHGWDEATGLAAAGVKIVDLLFDGHVFREFLTPRVESRHTHGTGCTFASAVAAGLALGLELADAAACLALADASIAQRLGQFGDSAVAMIDLEINRQALMIAYIDDFHAMMLVTLAAMPLVWLLRKARK